MTDLENMTYAQVRERLAFCEAQCPYLGAMSYVFLQMHLYLGDMNEDIGRTHAARLVGRVGEKIISEDIKEMVLNWYYQCGEICDRDSKQDKELKTAPINTKLFLHES